MYVYIYKHIEYYYHEQFAEKMLAQSSLKFIVTWKYALWVDAENVCNHYPGMSFLWMITSYWVYSALHSFF